MLKIVIVAGARPNFMKVAPLIRQCQVYPDLEPILVHTGQHYDYNMSKTFFEELDIPEPGFFLEIVSGSHSVQTSKTMISFEQVLLQRVWLLYV